MLHTSGDFNCPYHVNVHTFHCTKLNGHTWNMRNKIANKYRQTKRTSYQQRTINFLKTFYWCFQWRCLWGVDWVNGVSLVLGLLCCKQHLVGKCKHCCIACCGNDNNRNVSKEKLKSGVEDLLYDVLRHSGMMFWHQSSKYIFIRNKTSNIANLSEIFTE